VQWKIIAYLGERLDQHVIPFVALQPSNAEDGQISVIEVQPFAQLRAHGVVDRRQAFIGVDGAGNNHNPLWIDA
jgi:hypothetical protein